VNTTFLLNQLEKKKRLTNLVNLFLSSKMISKKDHISRQHLSRLAERLLSEMGGIDDTQGLKELISALSINLEMRKNIALLIRDFCADHMRREIYKFAGLMELKLLKHDPARGDTWKKGLPDYHLSRIQIIVNELIKAVKSDKLSCGIKAADLANHAMMLADLAGDLDDV